MALVAYEDSDIEDSDEEIFEDNNVITKSTVLDIQICEPVNGEKTLFSSLPLPKTNAHVKIPEDDDIFLQRKEKTPGEQISKSSRSTVKISIPSLSKISDVKPARGLEETGPKNNTTRLLSMLPEPKFGQSKLKTNSQKFVPRNVSVTKPDSSKPINPKKSEVNPIRREHIASDESDTEDTADSDKNQSDFFSLNSVLEEFIPESEIPVDTKNKIRTFIDPGFFPEENITNHTEPQENDQDINYGNEVQLSDDFQGQSSTQAQIDNQVPLPLDEEAIKKLGGRRGRHRQEVQIIDIDQKEILPDSREWLLKALTEDNSNRKSASKRRGDEPTNQQKRKHQITYLAHQAKANEQELQNQWSSNRMSRKQTQSKYGF